MQPTEIQVQKSLVALQETTDAGLEGDPGASTTDDIPEGLLQLLTGSDAVRLDRMADARMRLDAGEVPTGEDLASRVVGRLVCDRLR